MIRLGSIALSHPAALHEARRKIRSIAEACGGDAVTATRLAAVTSEMARRLQGDDRARLVVDIDPGRALELSFVAGELPGVEILTSFFDRVEAGKADGGCVVRARLGLPLSGSFDDGRVAMLEGILRQKSRDELMVEVQAKNLELQDSLDSLRRTRSAKERMESELNIGREIQMSMLPLSFPAFTGQHAFDVHAALHPAREVGGDFYDLFLVDDDHFCFCVGDVSGKGVPAALFMAVTKTLIKSRAANDLSPASILSHVNTELSERNESCMFVTAFLAILNLRTGQLAYCNAGHNPPYVQCADGGLARLDRRHGPVIGAQAGVAYREDALRLASGDLLFLYTDGVTEAKSPGAELYTETRLRQLLQRRRFESPQEAVAASVADVLSFQGAAEQADDISVLAVRYHGASNDAHFELKVVNRIAEIDTLNRAFGAFASRHGLPTWIRQKLSLCFDELLSNVIAYGYDDGGEHGIDVDVRLAGQRVLVTISDDGVPFNPFEQRFAGDLLLDRGPADRRSRRAPRSQPHGQRRLSTPRRQERRHAREGSRATPTHQSTAGD